MNTYKKFRIFFDELFTELIIKKKKYNFINCKKLKRVNFNTISTPKLQPGVTGYVVANDGGA